jgi:hypothetical protein
MNVPPTWLPTCIGWAVVSRESNDPSPPAHPRRPDLRGEPPWHSRQRHLPALQRKVYRNLLTAGSQDLDLEDAVAVHA